MESWRLVLRQGFLPLMSDAALEAVAKALREDDSQLLQGATTQPPPLNCVQDWPCEGACFLGFAGWQGDGLQTVGEVAEYFAKACFDADAAIGEPAACRLWLNHWDDTPRPALFAETLAEVEQEQTRRQALEVS